MRTSLGAMAVIIGSALLAASPSALAQGPTQPQTEQEKQNIAIVRDFWRDVWEGHDGNAVPKYLFEGYIEHNNGATNGRSTMERVFGRPRAAGAPQMKVVSQTIYARGPYVLLLQNRLGPDRNQPGKTSEINMIEMVKVYDGLMQAHWMLYPEGHTPTTQPQTEQESKNVAMIRSFWHQVWNEHNDEAIRRYVAEGYIEHNNGATNGRASLERLFGHPRLPGATPTRVVSQTIYARGSFVLLLQDREGPDPTQAGKARKINTIEMFQVYDGLVQEHWMLFPQGGMWPSED